MKTLLAALLVVATLEIGFEEVMTITAHAAMVWLAVESCKLVWGMIQAEAKGNG